MAVWREMEPAQRWVLAALWVACAVIGSIAITSMHRGLLDGLLGALAFTLAIAWAAPSSLRGASLLRGLGVAVTGGMILPPSSSSC